MIELEFPGIKQDDFNDAFQVLEESKVTDLPAFGFIHPFMGPGGQYGACWWERDTSLALSGYKYKDQKFCENVLRNFLNVQKLNGRIPLYGMDHVSGYDGELEELSAIPVIFEVALKTLQRSTDKDLIRDMRDMLGRYLEWWLSDIKRDPESGLICAVFEESDPSDSVKQLNIAPIDLNVQVCVGADVLAQMSDYLDEKEKSVEYRRIFSQLANAINKYMYCSEDGAYYAWLTKDHRLQKHRLYNSMFDLFKFNILLSERAKGVLRYLTDDSCFGFDNRYGITTMAKGCEEYVETVGVYQGWRSWSGNIWTLRNEIIITGLREYGLRKLSSKLAYQTVIEFNGNYTEFLCPSTGIGHGVQRYSWTASQYIQIIIEEIFGIRYNAWTNVLTVDPNVPDALAGQNLAIRNVPLGDGRMSSVCIENAGPNQVVSFKNN